MLDLLADVAVADAAYERFSVWGYGKTAWWWQHQCGIVRVEPSIELNLRFDLDGLWLGGGWGWPTSSQVERYRRAVDDETSGAELVEIVESLRGLGFEVSGTTLQRVPRAFPRDHPRGELLRHRSLTAARLIDDESVLHSSAAVESVLETYDLIRPLIGWEIDHIAAFE